MPETLRDRLIRHAHSFFATRPPTNDVTMKPHGTVTLFRHADLARRVIVPTLEPVVARAAHPVTSAAHVVWRAGEGYQVTDRNDFTTLICDLLAALPVPVDNPRIRFAVRDTQKVARPGASNREKPHHARHCQHVAAAAWRVFATATVRTDLAVSWPAHTDADIDTDADDADTTNDTAARAAAEDTARAFLAALAPGRLARSALYRRYRAATAGDDVQLGKYALFALASAMYGPPSKVRGIVGWRVPAPAAQTS